MRQLEPLYINIPWVNVDPNEFTTVSCLLCGNNNYKNIKPLIINNYEFQLVQCEEDKIFWLNPQPGETFIKSLYSEPYYNVGVDHPQLLSQLGFRGATEEEHLHKLNVAKIRIEEWKSAGIDLYTPSGERRKLLEVGGSYGHVQIAAREEGWDTIGLEISDYCVQECRKKGLDVDCMDLAEFGRRYPPESIDLIAMYDLLEHLPNPREYLKVARNLLKNEGYLITRLPILSEDEIPTLFMVHHFWHFNQSSLEKLLEQEGFEVFKRFESGIYQFREGKAQGMTFFARKI